MKNSMKVYVSLNVVNIFRFLMSELGLAMLSSALRTLVLDIFTNGFLKCSTFV